MSLLTPIFKHKFRFLPLMIGGENSQIIASNVQDVDVCFSTKTIKVFIRQTYDHRIMNAIKAFTSEIKPCIIDLMTLGVNEQVAFSIKPDIKNVTHSLGLTYTDSSQLMHQITIECHDLDIVPEVSTQYINQPPIPTHADSFITPQEFFGLETKETESSHEENIEKPKKKRVKKTDEQES